jgi:hypothetical protein
VNQPFTPPPPTVTYSVSINSGEWRDFQTPVAAAKFVADNIRAGRDADVRFENAFDIQTVQRNFEERINNRLIEFGHKNGFWQEPTPQGKHYRLLQ